MAAPERASQDRISQFDYDLLPELSVLLGIDAVQFVKEMEEEEEKDREGMERGFRPQMRSEAKRLQTFVTYHPYSSWTPQEMAAAGFYFTGTKNRVQCFCCGLILCGSRLRRRPLDNHRELGPDCEFLSGKDVGNIAKYDVRVKSPGGELSAHQVRGQDEEARLSSFRLWPFYVQGISPRALSAAGFVFTGKRDIVQCFSCGGCLGNWEEGDDPWKEHAKWFPKCEFLQSKKTSEEIIQYIQSYEGFVDVTGEHFLKSWVQRELPMPSAYGNDSVFANEDLRRDSFKNWPHKSPVGAAALARAGLFYTGIEDVVQCFLCGGCLKNWKEGDDPLEDHTKYFPNCQFLQTLKSSAQVAPDLEGHGELPELTESTKGSSPKESVEFNSTGPGSTVKGLKSGNQKATAGPNPPIADGQNGIRIERCARGAQPCPCLPATERTQGEAQWLQEAKSLSEQLRAAYTDATFRRMTLLEVSSSLATDPLLGCDLSIVTKHVSSPMQKPVALHEALAALNSVMCVEGEAGSGKTVLLKKIAFLWASGCCPLLNRFQLVFYLSLGSTRPDQGLASIICSQLLGTEGSVTEMCLRTIIQQLKNQVLFLLDDYKEMCSLPQVIEKLIQKNHLSQTCVLIAVRTNRARALRRYLDRTLEITAFPFYNTVYILRTFFLHNISRLQRFMVHFGMNEDLQGIQKTPLFVAAVCADWFRRPFHQSFDDDAVFRCYMECLSLKHSPSAELLKATVSSCGELALKGFFVSCYEFDGSELTEAGVDEDEDLTMSLMSRFSAQRLRPVYRFLNPAFQEFLAGMRLIELLDSDRQEDQDLGLFYLRHIDSSIMAVSPYANFLNYISSHTSTKAGPKIVSHLLQLMSNEASLEIISEDDDYAKRHPRMSEKMQIFRSLWQVSPQAYFSLVSEHFLSLALKIAYQSDTVAACSPFVLEFLRGRTLTWKVLQLQYFFDHPESLLLLRSIQVLIQGVKGEPRPDFSVMAACLDKSQAPTIDQDYASVFEPMKDWEQELAEKEESLKNFLKIRRQAPPDLGAGYWKLSPKQPKIPLLQVHVTRADAVDQDTLRALTAAFSASQHIELHLSHSRGFIESIRPALELCKASVTKCSIGNAELSPEEQELLLALPSLESLHVEGMPQLQDQIFPNLDKFLHLKELSVNLQGKLNVFSILPEDSPSFHQMEKLLVRVSAECDPSKLGKGGTWMYFFSHQLKKLLGQ
ncbi:baculoviral IAP repeat-containing protein 1-like [Lepus europaeus]|uniref:baculoviral IAP repeat-containing protein 1-like n=1 Tax=Lepus europaeus TaxID=9983 RepID=UPI002B47A0A9|nr:baculoviral IAP repeat-containing protein 1-like [Lepus europaeus]